MANLPTLLVVNINVSFVVKSFFGKEDFEDHKTVVKFQEY